MSEDIKFPSCHKHFDLDLRLFLEQSFTSVNNSILPAEINENSVTYTVVFADAYRKHINAKSNVSKLVVFCV